jgi:hypothetical protein
LHAQNIAAKTPCHFTRGFSKYCRRRLMDWHDATGCFQSRSGKEPGSWSSVTWSESALMRDRDFSRVLAQ